MRILIAEDDPDIAGLVSHYLQKSGWDTRVEASGDRALAYARAHPVDLVILDVMLPGMSGLEVCRALRAEAGTARIPIIMLTARVDEADRVAGLELGADDYVSKPFSPNELVARIRALMRRAGPSQRPEPMLRFGPITIDLASHTVAYEGGDVKLTAKEFLLLRHLLQNIHDFTIYNPEITGINRYAY